MKIVADENIPYVCEAFGTLGEVAAMPGRAMSREAVADADLLLVRSITKVSRALLEGTPVRFVATATIGEDHIDKDYLAARGIGYSSAPGCNANSVGQYLTAVLVELEARLGIPLAGNKLGIVGVGNVGTRVLATASALGLECVLNDPPRARAEGGGLFQPIEAIYECDFVTLHVPLTKEGPDPTHHLADEAFVRALKPGAVLINSARGAVADNRALRRALDDGHLRACVLDVWEGEPNPDAALLERVFIGTPHIAGYSFDGKVNGTTQIYQAACRFLQVEARWHAGPLLPEPETPALDVDGANPHAVRDAVRAVYDVMRDDAAMRALLTAEETARPGLFDQLRKQYPRRREFFNTEVRVDPPHAALEEQLAGVGFTIRRRPARP